MSGGAEHFVIVAGPDGTKYKMLMKTEVAYLALSKVKRYLHKAISVPPERQVLRFNGAVVHDAAVGADIGLFDGAVLQLDVLQPTASSVQRTSRSSTPRGQRPASVPPSPSALTAMESQQRQIDTLREQVLAMQRSPQPHAQPHAQPQLQQPHAQPPTRPEDMVPATLRNFCEALSVPTALQLDSNHTCIVNVPVAGGDPVTLLITFDPTTGRLHLYTTLLSQLPADPALRLGLYEALMEGALLGRDMAGGGVGLSPKNNLVLMSVSFDLAHSDEHCLAAVSRSFLDAAIKWMGVVQSFAA